MVLWQLWSVPWNKWERVATTKHLETECNYTHGVIFLYDGSVYVFFPCMVYDFIYCIHFLIERSQFYVCLDWCYLVIIIFILWCVQNFCSISNLFVICITLFLSQHKDKQQCWRLSARCCHASADSPALNTWQQTEAYPDWETTEWIPNCSNSLLRNSKGLS